MQLKIAVGCRAKSLVKRQVCNLEPMLIYSLLLFQSWLWSCAGPIPMRWEILLLSCSFSRVFRIVSLHSIALALGMCGPCIPCQPCWKIAVDTRVNFYWPPKHSTRFFHGIIIMLRFKCSEHHFVDLKKKKLPVFFLFLGEWYLRYVNVC